jgi:hypothetical protein
MKTPTPLRNQRGIKTISAIGTSARDPHPITVAYSYCP